MEVDNKPWLREQAEERERLIEALGEVLSTKGWAYLLENVFSGAIETLERRLVSEAKKNDPDKLELIRLNSQLVSLKKFTDLRGIENICRDELLGIRKKLQE